MPDAPRPSLPETLSVASLGLLTLTGGWFIVWHDGFSSALGKRSREFVHVSGTPAVAVAILQFTVAALALTWFLKSRVGMRTAGMVAFGVVFVPPLLFRVLA